MSKKPFIIKNGLSANGTLVIGANGKLHANNSITNGTISGAHLEDSGTATGTFGSGSKIPVITVDSKGRITSIANTDVAGVTGVTFTAANNNLRISTADGATYDAQIDIDDSIRSFLNGNVNTHVIPTGNEQWDLGTSNHKFRDLYLSTGTIHLGNASISATSSGQLKVPDLKLGNAVISASASGEISVPTLKVGNTSINTTDSGLDADLLNGQQGSYYTEYADALVADLISSAPAALDTLNELAAALGDDANFSTTVTNQIAAKADASHTHDDQYYTETEVDAKLDALSSGGGGGGGNTVDLVASGTLPNGAPVILKADGTVESVGYVDTIIPESIPAGSEYVFNPGTTSYTSIAFDPNTPNKFVVCYMDDSNYDHGTAVVGIVSGTSISFGSEYVFNSGISAYTSVAFDPNTPNKFVVCYRDIGNSKYGTAVVGTVSGTSISFGSEYVFNSADTNYVSVAFDPNNAGKFVVCYQDIGNSYYGTACVGTVSGTSISFGSEYVFNSGTTIYPSVAFDPNNAGKFVVCYRGSSNYGTAIVGTVSGTSISFGSEYVFHSETTNYVSVAIDPNNADKFVVCYMDYVNPKNGAAVVGTVSGTSISFGSAYVFNPGSTKYISVTFDPNTPNKFVVCYMDDSNYDHGTAVVGTVSGTSISFGSEIVFNPGATDYVSVAIDPNTPGKFVVCYKDKHNTNYGTAVVGQIETTVTSTNLTTNNYIGFSEDTYADGVASTIMLKGGVSTKQTGLTIGDDYYVQSNGTLSTTPDDPSVYAGSALSSNNLLVKSTSAKLDISHTHDDQYYTETEVDAKFDALSANTVSTANLNASIATINATINSNIANTNAYIATRASEADSLSRLANTNAYIATVSDQIAAKADASHTHDDQYYTETEVDAKFDALPTQYYTETEVDAKFDALPSGGGGNTVDLVASGTLPNGAPVILKADGTVEAVGSDVTIIPEPSIPAGSESVFNSGTTIYPSVAFDPNNAGKFVVCYEDNSNSGYGTACVGTVSGTSISFGSESVFNSGTTIYPSVAFDPNNAGKFVVCYKDNSNSGYGTACVGTVSGTSISFGSEYVFNYGTTNYVSFAIDPNNVGKFVVCYSDGGNSSYGTACVGTVSGTSISFGSEYVFNSGDAYYISVAIDPNTPGKFVVCYSDGGNSSYGTAVVGTVSGTSISFGSEYCEYYSPFGCL